MVPWERNVTFKLSKIIPVPRERSVSIFLLVRLN